MLTKKLPVYFLSLFIALLPLFNTSLTLDPVLTLRFLLLSILVSVLFLVNGGSFINKGVIKNPIIITLFSLFIFFSISSFFSNYVISESIYHTLKIGVLLLLLFSLVYYMNNFRDLLLKSVVIFSLAATFLAISQYLSAYLNGWVFEEVNQIAGTMANKNLLASVLFLSIPTCIYVVYCLKSKIWKILGSVSIICSVFIFSLIQSKAIIVALLLASLTLLVLNWKVKQVVLRLGFFSIIILFIFLGLNQLGVFENRLFRGFSDSFNIVKQLDKINDKQSSTGARLYLYKNTFQIIKKYPALGVGPGNWRLEIPKAGLYLTQGERGNSIVQRPHSDFLWVMVEAGILAGLLYIFLFLLVLIESYKLYRDSEGTERFFYSVVFSFVLGYMFISAVDFPMERIEHNVLFFLLISVVISGQLKKVKNDTLNYNKPIRIICVVLALCASYVGYARHQGEIHASSAKIYKGKERWQKIITEINKAYRPGIYEIDRSSTPLQWYSGVAKFSLGRLDAAFNDFQKAYELNPHHLHVINNIATCYELKGDRNRAIQYYEKALAISPRFEESSVNLSAILYNEKKYEEALDVLLRCNIPMNKKKYNRYLSVIFKTYVSAEFNNVTEKNKMINLVQLPEKDWSSFYQYMLDLYELRKVEEKTYKYYLNKGLKL